MANSKDLCVLSLKQMSKEVELLENVLQDIHDSIKGNEIYKHKLAKLLEYASICGEVLEKMKKMLSEHVGLDDPKRFTKERFTWDQKTCGMINNEMHRSISLLNTFYTSITNSSVFRIEKQIRKAVRGIVADDSSSRRASTAVSQMNDPDGNINDADAAWSEFIDVLQEKGISAEDANIHREDIVDQFQDTINKRALDEALSGDFSNGSSPVAAPDVAQLPEALPIGEEEPDDDTFAGLIRTTTQGRNSLVHTPEAHDLKARIVGAWNSRQWPIVQIGLKTLIRGSAGSSLRRRWYTHLLAIAYGLCGQFPRAKAILAGKPPLEDAADDEQPAFDPPELDWRQRSARRIYSMRRRIRNTKRRALRTSSLRRLLDHRNKMFSVDIWDMLWLGDICLQLGELDNALVSWAVAIRLMSTVTCRSYERISNQVLAEFHNLINCILGSKSDHSSLLAGSDVFDDCSSNELFEVIKYAWDRSEGQWESPMTKGRFNIRQVQKFPNIIQVEHFRKTSPPTLTIDCFDERSMKDPQDMNCDVVLFDNMLSTRTTISALLNDPEWRHIAQVKAQDAGAMAFVTKRKPDWIATTIMSALKENFPDRQKASVTSNSYDSGRWRVHCYMFYKVDNIGFAVRLSCEIVKVALLGPYGVRVYQKPEVPLRDVHADFRHHDPLQTFKQIVTTALTKANQAAGEVPTISRTKTGYFQRLRNHSPKKNSSVFRRRTG